MSNPDVLLCIADLSNDEVFTPPTLANLMLDNLPQELFKNKNAKFLDPFTKTGVYLREIARRLNEGLKDVIINEQERIDHILKNQVFGIAITELTSLISRRSLYYSKNANSNNSATKKFNNEQGNIFFNETKHTFVNGRCTYCGASKQNYERGDMNSYAYQIIHNNIPKEIEEMKFDVIIGNPPYQLKDGEGGNGTSSIPIYPHFIRAAKKLNPKYISMIIPARWYSGGKGLDDFRAEMLNDKNITHIVDYQDSKDCFNGVEVKGGIMYFLWEQGNKNKPLIANFKDKNEKLDFIQRDMLINNMSTFIRDNSIIDLFNKIYKKSSKMKSFDNIVLPRKPFGIESNFKNYSVEKNENSIEIVMLVNKKRDYVYVDEKHVIKGHDFINKYKVFVSKAGKGGYKDKDDQVIAKPFIGNPGTICSETYLVVGSFNSKNQALNLMKYMESRVFRFLVSILKVTQNAARDVYGLVPIFDFDIEINDEYLYKYFDLTQSEIKIIESRILPMNQSATDLESDGDDE